VENEVQKTTMFIRFRTSKKVDLQASKKRCKSFKSSGQGSKTLAGAGSLNYRIPAVDDCFLSPHIAQW
jgi:hypothetical protein